MFISFMVAESGSFSKDRNWILIVLKTEQEYLLYLEDSFGMKMSSGTKKTTEWHIASGSLT